MPDQAADVLAGNDTPPPPQAVAPVEQNWEPSGDSASQDPLANLGSDTPPPTPQTTPANKDPEMVAGAAHQSVLARAIHAVASTLGGDVTHHVVKDPDGTYSVHLDTSTSKEQWGRIAAAVLGGAAKGMAVGQGPGGGARAVGAGFDQGFGQQKQIDSEATAQAKAKNDELTFKANHAMTDQQLIALTYGNKMNPIRDAREEGEYEMKLSDLGANLEAHPNNAKELAAYNKANPNLMSAHLMKDGSVLIPSPQSDGTVKIWRVPPNMAKRKVDHDVDYDVRYLDDEGNIQHRTETIIKNTKTAAEIALAMKGNDLASNNTINTALTLKNSRDKTELEKKKDAREEELQPIEIGAKRATTAEARARAKLVGLQTNLLPQPGAAGATAAGVHGEPYLQASGLDPSMFAQVRATAKGDLKMPTASRSPQNQMFRNTVMNYDPTFTDARYDVKQDFKNKKQADNLQALSTGLEHVERAAINSAKLGDSPSLLSGVNLSGAASAYNQDINFFANEAGKLVKNGVIGQDEYRELKKGMESPLQSIRDSAIKETVKLLGGRVSSTMQRYKAASGMALPVQEFFDQPTQDRLNRYGIAASGGEQPTGTIDVPAGGKVYHFKTQAEADTFKDNLKNAGAPR